ncbi:hypothetical protein CSA80_03075 [Candidatus Saccharibacteria bacterium]|nr:MAG: hypothetical protein CR973_00230 [Candidatus Saccharibacteria bacterium]PID99072.1 MAG: hypothetical protein CSA80_03075 [Candidatus Saccharibacteria bacterium]
MQWMSWSRLRTWQARRSDRVLVLCASFLAGLILARLHWVLPSWFVVLLGLLAIAGVKKPVFQFVVLGLFGLSLGIWRGAAYLQALQPYQEFARQKVTITGKVSLDAVYGKHGQLSFEIKKVQFHAPRAVEVPGTVRVSGFGELAIYRGDIVQATGKLYPTRGGKQAAMGYAQLERIGNEQTWIDGFRRSFVAGIQTALPEPAASFGLGLLIGQRNTLPAAISHAFLMVGLMHIIAVSGYNLTILVSAARRLLEKRSKLLMITLAGGLMTFFLLITGAAPSVVRAAVVSGLGLAAWYYGRRVRPMVLILLAAALTSYATPVYFWSDIAWWLSVLAFFGILVIAPAVMGRLYRDKKPSVLMAMAIETLSAELMTMPLIMYIFGQVSLIALLANLLVALFVPYAMLLSFIAGAVGMLAPLLSGWVAWPAQILLTYMLDTAVVLSRLPNVFHTNIYISALDMALCYALVIWLLFLLKRRKMVWFSAVHKG